MTEPIRHAFLSFLFLFLVDIEIFYLNMKGHLHFFFDLFQMFLVWRGVQGKCTCLCEKNSSVSSKETKNLEIESLN